MSVDARQRAQAMLGTPVGSVSPHSWSAHALDLARDVLVLADRADALAYWLNRWGDLLVYKTTPKVWRDGYEQAIRDTAKRLQVAAPGEDSDPDIPSGASPEGNDGDTGAAHTARAVLGGGTEERT